MNERRTRWVAVVVLGVALGAAGLSIRRQRREIAAETGRPRALQLELAYHVAIERAADRLFASSLDALVGNLERGGARVGYVAPEPRAAVLGVPGLDDKALRAALASLPLQADGGERAVAQDRVRVRLTGDAAAAAEDDALRTLAAVIRARLGAAGYTPEHGALLTIDARAARLVIRLPLLDDKHERRLKLLLETTGAASLHALDAGDVLATAMSRLPDENHVATPSHVERDATGYASLRVPVGRESRALLDLLRPPLVPGTAMIATDEHDGQVTMRLVEHEALAGARDFHAVAGHEARFRLAPDVAAHVRMQHPSARFLVLLDGEIASAPLTAADLDAPIELSSPSLRRLAPSPSASPSGDGDAWLRGALRLLVETGPLPVPLQPLGERVMTPRP